MNADAAPIEARSATSKVRLLSLAALDGRTVAARRAKELIESIESDLGGADQLSEGAKQLVQRAAVLGTYVESCEAQWLAGEEVDLTDYLAAINAQRRVLATIGLERRAKDISHGDYLAQLAKATQDRSSDVVIENTAASVADEGAGL